MVVALFPLRVPPGIESPVSLHLHGLSVDDPPLVVSTNVRKLCMLVSASLILVSKATSRSTFSRSALISSRRGFNTTFFDDEVVCLVSQSAAAGPNWVSTFVFTIRRTLCPNFNLGTYLVQDRSLQGLDACSVGGQPKFHFFARCSLLQQPCLQCESCLLLGMQALPKMLRLELAILEFSLPSSGSCYSWYVRRHG